MAENQGQTGNDPQGTSEFEQQNSPQSEQGFSGNEGGTATQTAQSQGETGDPGRTPGKAEGEDDSSATSGGSN